MTVRNCRPCPVTASVCSDVTCGESSVTPGEGLWGRPPPSSVGVPWPSSPGTCWVREGDFRALLPSLPAGSGPPSFLAHHYASLK